MTIDVYRSSSEDFSFSAEIIDAATEGLAVPAAYRQQSGHRYHLIKTKSFVPFVFAPSHTVREVLCRRVVPILIALPF